MGRSEVTTKPHVPVAPLQNSLDLALRDCFQLRASCQDEQETTLKMAGDNRKLVLRLARSAERLRAATERLEGEARAAHRAHAADKKATAQRFAQACALLVAQRNTAEATLCNEIKRYEEEQSTNTQAVSKFRVKSVLTKLDAQRGRSAAQSLATHMAELEKAHQEVVSRSDVLERRVKELESDNARFLKERMMENTDRERERLEFHARIKLLDDELRQSAEGRGLLQQELQRERERTAEAERAKQLAIELADQARKAAARQAQGEIDRLYALRDAALAAGSYKGRQILYMDSLQPRAARVDDPVSIERTLLQSTLTWHGGGLAEAALRQLPDMPEPPPGRPPF